MQQLTKAVHFLVRMFADWPLPYLVLAAMIWQGSFTIYGVLIFLLSLVVTTFNFSVLGTFSDRKIWREIHDYLYRYKSCHFQAHPLTAYIPEEALSKDSYFSQEKHVNRYWDKHRASVLERSRVFSVKGGEQPGERPSGLKAFPTNRMMLIFSREEPNELNPVLRFKIYHEYFHASVPALLSKRRIMLGIGPSFLMVAYLALHMEWRMDTIALLLSIAAIFYTGYKYYWASEKKEEAMYAELYADHLALKFLSEQDRQFILKYKHRNLLIVDDPSLSPLQNITRKYYFQDVLTQYQQGKEPSIYEIQASKDYPSYIYLIFLVAIYLCASMKPLDRGYLYLDLLLLGIIVVVLFWTMRKQIRYEGIVGDFLKINTSH